MASTYHQKHQMAREESRREAGRRLRAHLTFWRLENDVSGSIATRDLSRFDPGLVPFCLNWPWTTLTKTTETYQSYLLDCIHRSIQMLVYLLRQHCCTAKTRLKIISISCQHIKTRQDSRNKRYFPAYAAHTAHPFLSFQVP